LFKHFVVVGRTMASTSCLSVQQEPIASGVPVLGHGSTGSVVSAAHSAVASVKHVQLPLSSQVSVVSGLSGVPQVLDSVGDWKQETLDAHNKHRDAHGVPRLQWDASCESCARKQATYLARCGKPPRDFHGNNPNQGQNVYMSWASNGAPCVSPAEAVDEWYSEIKDYDFDRDALQNAPGHITGHFTQVVWKGTTKVGMAKASGNGRTWVVANYSPQGNVRMIGRPGWIKNNVPRPRQNSQPLANKSAGDSRSSWQSDSWQPPAGCGIRFSSHGKVEWDNHSMTKTNAQGQEYYLSIF